MSILKTSICKDFGETAILLHVLGCETRLKILKLVGEKDYTSKDVANELHQSPSNITQQTQILVDAGLIERIRLKDGTSRKILKPLYNKMSIELRRNENGWHKKDV